MKKLELYFDGGNEKGIATWAVLGKTNGKTIAKFVGIVDPSLPQTNNVSEWTALYMALLYAKSNDHFYDKIFIMGDSELVVNQINGKYACKHPNLINLYEKSMNLYTIYNQGKISVAWIPREQNTEVDALGRTIRG